MTGVGVDIELSQTLSGQLKILLKMGKYKKGTSVTRENCTLVFKRPLLLSFSDWPCIKMNAFNKISPILCV